jgi:enamine deaminase RidA (YjgF/YER057c/UK114 family)
MTKPNREYLVPSGSPQVKGYSQVVKVNKGTLVYLAGQVPNDVSDNLVGEGDFGAQVEQVFRNIKTAVEAAGGTMANLIKINNYIVASVDSAELAKFRVVRDRYINTEAPPASTLVYVSRLARPGWLVEIEAVAVIDG